MCVINQDAAELHLMQEGVQDMSVYIYEYVQDCDLT